MGTDSHINTYTFSNRSWGFFGGWFFFYQTCISSTSHIYRTFLFHFSIIVQI